MATSSSAEGYADDEVFEINDFTVVTSLEKFIASLEVLFHDWALGKASRDANRYKISKGSLAACEWDSKSESIPFGESNALNFTYYWPRSLPRPTSVTDCSDALNLFAHDDSPEYDYLTSASKVMMLPEVEFCPSSIICNQFGVLEFVLVTPLDPLRDTVVNESQLETILSGATVALSTTESEVPVFVQYGEAARQLFFGISQNHSMRTNFEAAHLRRPMAAHSHLSGLLELFADKVKSPKIEKPSVRVSVQLDYVLQERLDAIPDFAATCGDPMEEGFPDTFFGNTSNLAFGAVSDVLDKISLIAIWPNLREEMLNENDVYSDLDPLTAPFWAAAVSFQSGISCYLHQSLKSLVGMAESIEGKRLLSELLFLMEGDPTISARRALSSLTVPQDVSIVNPSSRTNESSALPSSAIFRWIEAIFVKTKESFVSTESSLKESSSRSDMGEASGGPGAAVKQSADCAFANARDHSYDKRIPTACINYLNACKSSPLNSLTSRIAIALTHVLSGKDYSAGACAELWAAVVRELRTRWESNTFLPGIDESGSPDLAMCLLHQKLQMLQSCIDARLKRHRLLDATTAHKGEEFYDAVDWLSEEEDAETLKTSQSASEQSSPQGRLRKFSGLSLLKRPDISLYEPITQERCPMTEDMLEKRADYLSSLECPEARAKAHLDSLRSDMQAFKAANPGSEFEDFVRWHSPRDYIFDEATGEGCLSNRMSGENAWKEAWDDAEAVPVVHQARLFNESKEAESILQEFGRLSLRELIELILPVAIKCAAKQILDESVEVVKVVEQKLIDFCEKVSICTRSDDFEDYLDAFRELLVLETNAARYNALWSRFCIADDSLVWSKEGTEDVRELAVRLLEQSYRAAEFGSFSGGKEGCIASVPIERAIYSRAGSTLRKLFLTDARLDTAPPHADTGSTKTKAEGSMPPYSRRQYTFRWFVPRPGGSSRPMPQRMYASICDEHFRVCSSISDDCVLT